MSRKPSLDTIIKHIITDTRKTTKAALEYAGQKVSDDLCKMAYLALDNYYSEYDPEYYRRTNDLRNNVYYKINKRDGFSIKSGVVFDHEKMNHKHKGHYSNGDPFTEFDIYNNFLDGFHGYKWNNGTQQAEEIRGADHKAFMDGYYDSYISKGKPYSYFQAYMDKHLNR